MREKINLKIDFCMCAGVCGSVCVCEYSATLETVSKISAASVEEGQREKEIEK